MKHWDEPTLRQALGPGGRSVSGGTLGAVSRSPAPWSVLPRWPRGWGSARALWAVGVRSASRQKCIFSWLVKVLGELLRS